MASLCQAQSNATVRSYLWLPGQGPGRDSGCIPSADQRGSGRAAGASSRVCWSPRYESLCSLLGAQRVAQGIFQTCSDGPLSLPSLSAQRVLRGDGGFHLEKSTKNLCLKSQHTHTHTHTRGVWWGSPQKTGSMNTLALSFHQPTRQ